MLTAGQVEELLQKEGVPFERRGDGWWRVTVRGESQTFGVYVRLTEHWIFFTIYPYVVAPRTEGCERNLFRHLLRLNLQNSLAKFAVDEDDDVALTVEYPRERFADEQFREGLDALVYVADRNYMDVLNLAQDEGAKLQ